MSGWEAIGEGTSGDHQSMHAHQAVSQFEKPCVLHRVHVPVTVINELHHVFPQEFQNDIWGEVRDTERWSVCSTGHNNVHAAIRFFDKTGKWPVWCRGRTRALAKIAIDRRARAAALR